MSIASVERRCSGRPIGQCCVGTGPKVDAIDRSDPADVLFA